jgi:4-hydroxy-2-oxoheptanedioate aldolase
MTDPLRARLGDGPPVVMLDLKDFLPTAPASLPRGTVDAIFVDCEHDALRFDQAQVMCARALEAGLAPIIRAAAPDAGLLHAYIDMGARGIVLPQVMGPDDVGAFMAAVRAHPAGDVLTIAQIETPQAVAALDAILTAGLAGPAPDAFLIGPNDLAAAMGHPGRPTHPDVVAAVTYVAARLRATRRAFGLPIAASGAGPRWQDAGATLFYIPLPALIAHGLARLTGKEP